MASNLPPALSLEDSIHVESLDSAPIGDLEESLAWGCSLVEEAGEPLALLEDGSLVKVWNFDELEAAFRDVESCLFALERPTEEGEGHPIELHIPTDLTPTTESGPVSAQAGVRVNEHPVEEEEDAIALS
ncbi:hypothetical protein M758_UG119600 [Ceratodon purpureus]|nr:hypothetical protein M758_UG119600 [Ceratodon purpureus]